MILAALVAFAFAQEAPDPQRVAKAELVRLSQEIRRHAAEGRMSAVEREYDKALRLGVPLDPHLHIIAAGAALERGAGLLALARYQRVAPDDPAFAEATENYQALTERYAYVWVTGTAKAAMTGPTPFLPTEARAVTNAVTTLAERGWYIGLLPTGEYQFPTALNPYHHSFRIEPRGSYEVVLP